MEVIKQYPLIEEIFSSYEKILGEDLEKYKNHVYRVFNYCLFLGDKTDEEKYAVAGVFHDLGIWTNDTFDYLQPSIALATKYLTQHNKEKDAEEISLMIDHHHKITSYKNKFENTVEIFRKADWTDVSMSVIHFEIPKSFIADVEKQFPYKAFHMKLVKLFLSNFTQHPIKPLPMFKK
ncbi:MAG: hypothetical protein JWN78_1051 [Bacteroidota bacterium]|nr:hypothetical protein [Bacteroidota bacterium]